MTRLPTVPLGTTGIQISRIGFGAMHLAYLDSCSPEQGQQVLHRAFELGVTLIDTADRYCQDESEAHINEKQIAAALATHAIDSASVCVATKGGMLRPGGMWVRFGKPEHIRRTIRESFDALGSDKPIPLWQYHQLDRNYPLEETLGVVKQAVDDGLIRHVGVSNFSVEELQRARQVIDIVSVQCEYNLWCREVERNGVLKYCEQEGLTLLAWRPLGGKPRARSLDSNQAVLNLARAADATPQQLALAWLIAKSSCVVPIPGSTRLEGVEACVRAADLELGDAEMRTLEAAVDEAPPSLRLVDR